MHKKEIAPVGDISIAVVIPAYNEAESIAPLYEALRAALDPLDRPYELLFVDDGSTDGTLEKIEALEVSGHALKCISFRRNFGKSQALAAGFAEARGRIVITMDADLQDDPGEIPNLIAKIEEGWDVVSGWKMQRKDPIEKRLASKVFNGILSRISGVKLHDFNCGLKAYRREVVEKLSLYGEHHRFIPVLSAALGYRVCEIPVHHRKRQFGRSKYGFGRYFSGLFDLFTITLLTSYKRRPLHFLGRLGLAPFLVGLAFVVYAVVAQWIPGRPGAGVCWILGGVCVLVSFQILLVGLLGELVSHSMLAPRTTCRDFEARRIVRGEAAPGADQEADEEEEPAPTHDKPSGPPAVMT